MHKWKEILICFENDPWWPQDSFVIRMALNSYLCLPGAGDWSHVVPSSSMHCWMLNLGESVNGNMEGHWQFNLFKELQDEAWWLKDDESQACLGYLKLTELKYRLSTFKLKLKSLSPLLRITFELLSSTMWCKHLKPQRVYWASYVMFLLVV